MNLISKFLLIILISGLPLEMISQTCCSAGAPLGSSFVIANNPIKSFNLSLGYEYESINLLVDNNRRIQNDPRSRLASTISIKLDYIINERFSSTVVLPYIIQNRTTRSDTQSAFGFGDLAFLFQYNIFPFNKIKPSLGIGLKLPTGQNALREENGIILAPDMQSGTGTTDFIFQSAILFEHIFIPKLNINTSLVYRYNTTNNSFGSNSGSGRRSFKFGNEILASLLASYQFVPGTVFLIPELGIQYRTTNPNEEFGFDASNSGGNWFALLAGVSIAMDNNFSIRLYTEIPVSQKLQGLQISTDLAFGIQLGYLFKKQNSLSI